MSISTKVMVQGIHDDQNLEYNNFVQTIQLNKIQYVIRNRLQLAEYFFEKKAFRRALDIYKEVILMEGSNEVANTRIISIYKKSIY